MNETYRDIEIYAPDGTLIRRHAVSSSDIRKFMHMSEDYIRLSFSLRDATDFPVGSYVRMYKPMSGGTETRDFIITKKQTGTWNAATGVWDYQLQFDAYYWQWANRMLSYSVEGVDSAKETSFSLTATIDIHANVICNCLRRLGFTLDGSPFRADTTHESLSAEAKLVIYQNLSVLGGIQAIAEAFECEWWVDGNAICFGKLENDTEPRVFGAGVNVSSVPFSSANTEAPNRVYVFGSDRNLPVNYRKVDGDDTIGGVVNKRLMLPEGTPYLQSADTIPDKALVESVIVLNEVYPRTSLTVEKDPDTYTSDEEQDDGSSVQHTYYRLRYGDSFRFSKDYILPDEELHIVFNSGRLNGMDFGARFNPKGLNEKNTDGSWNPEAQMIEVVANEDYGRLLPDDILKPAKGDAFILYGWDSTKMESLGLVADAEQELLEKGREEFEELRKDLSTCTCPMAWDYMKPLFERNTQPKPGDRVNIIDTAHFNEDGRASRIIGYEYKLDKPYAECTYTCGENISLSRLGTIERNIENLTKSGQKVRIENSLDFLSKRYADSTPYALHVGGLLTMGKGAMSREFVDGLLGFGFKITDSGDIYADSLTLRKFLEVPELRYNRTEVIVGNEWQAPGAGIVESYNHEGTTDVTQPDGEVATCNVGWITLKLEEGEIGSLSVGDFCMGVWHFSKNELNIGTGTPGGEGIVDENGNETEDADENNGNFRFAGFRTLYFYVYAVEGERNERLHVRTRSFYPTEPVEGLHFVAYGNDANPERQKSAYRTRTYTRYLSGVKEWTWGVDNIMMQLGDLSGLSINGEDMSGYSAYLNNVYFTGVIRQIDASPLRLTYTTLGDTYIGTRADGTVDSCVLQLTAMKGLADVTEGLSSVTCSAQSGSIPAGAVEKGYSGPTGTYNVRVNPAFLNGYAERTLTVTARYTYKGKEYTATVSILFRDLSLLKGDKGDQGDTGEAGTSFSPNLLAGSKTLPASWGTDNSGDCNKTVRPNADGFVEYTDTITSGSAQHTGYAWIQAMVEGGMSRFVNGRAYTLSFDYRASRAFEMGLRFRNADNDTATQRAYGGAFLPSESWTRGSVTFRPDGLTSDHTRLLLLETVKDTAKGDVFSFRKFCITEGESAAWSPADSEMIGKDAVTYEWQVNPGVIRCNDDGTLPGGTATVNVRCFRVEGDRRTELTIPAPPLLLANTAGRIQYSVAWNEGRTDWKDIAYDHDIVLTGDARDTYPKIHLRVARYTNAVTPTVEVLSAEHVVGNVCDGRPGQDGEDGGVGPAGAVMRMSGLWKSGVSCNNGTVTESDGVRWIDVVYVRDSSGTEYWYRCLRAHTSAESNMPGKTDHWGAISNLGDMMADVLIANQAFIKNLTTREVVFVNAAGNVVGRVGSPLPGNGAVMYTGQLDQANVNTDNATYLLDVTGYTRYGQLVKSNVRIWPDYDSTGGARICAYTAGGAAAGKEVVAIDGTAHEIGGAYGIVNTLSRTLTGLSFTSDKTYPYPGKLELPSDVTATLRMTIPVTLKCTSRKETTGTGTGLVRQSRCRGKFRIFRNGVIWEECTTSWCANTSISQGEDTSDARLDQTIGIDVSLTEAGTYTFEAESELTDMGLDPVTGIRHSASVSFGATEVNIKAGADPKAFLGANGLLVSNSTQDFFKAGIDNGRFGMEFSAGQQSGLRVTEADGVRLKGKTGAYDVEPLPATVGYVADANTCYRDRLGVSEYVTDGEHTMNLPSGAASKFGRLTVTTFSADNILQEFHTFSHPMQIWTRIKLSGTWRTWTKIV